MQIIKNVYQLECSKRGHVFLIKSDESILIDTGMPGLTKKIISEIESLDVPIRTIEKILLTHHDVDHIGNANKLQEATQAELWAPKEDIPYIIGAKNRPGIKRIIQAVVQPQKPSVFDYYKENQSFGEIKVIHAPGHTPGHSIFQYRNVLFTGDLFEVLNGNFQLLPQFMNWNHEEVKKSIALIKDLKFDWICPSHGEPIRRKTVPEKFLNVIKHSNSKTTTTSY